MAQRILKHGRTWDHTPALAKVIGQVFAVGDVLLFTERAVGASTLGAFSVGIAHDVMIEVPKDPALNFFDGQQVFWDETNSRVTATQGGWLHYGYVNGAYSNSDTTCTVHRLPPSDVTMTNAHSSGA